MTPNEETLVEREKGVQTVEAVESGERTGTPAPPSLRQIAEHVPLGHSCRSCGTSTYNVLTRLHGFLETGKPCCPNLAEWVRLAQEGGPTVNEKHSAMLRERYPDRGWPAPDGALASTHGQPGHSVLNPSPLNSSNGKG